VIFAWLGDGNMNCFFPGKGKIADFAAAINDLR
jgi:hypothetical protein